MLGHTSEADFNDTERTPKNLREVEAEAVALLCCEALESLQNLHEQLFIEPQLALGGDLPFPTFTITIYGFDEYARAYVEDYSTLIESVALQLINFDKKDNSSIASALDKSQMLVDHVLNIFMQQDLIKAEELNGGLIYIFEVSTKLKRMLKQFT